MKKLTNLFKSFYLSTYVHYFVLLVLIIGSFLLKTIPIYQQVFPQPDTVKYIDTDSYFYLRHTWACLKNFPQLQKYDFATHYPTGTDADVASFFPWVMALGLKSAGITDRMTAEKYLAWLMPLLSSFILLIYFLWGKLYGQVWVGLLAGLIWILLPGLSISRTMLGTLDHHILEMILALACAYQFDVLGVRGHSLSWQTSWWRGWPLAAFFLVWPGAPLFLLIFGLALMAWMVFQISKPQPNLHQASIYGSFFGGAMLILVLVKLVYPAWITGIQPLTFYMCLVAMLTGAIIPRVVLKQVTRYPLRLRRVKLPLMLTALVSIALIWFIQATEAGQEMWMRLQYQGEGISENVKLSLSEVHDSLGYTLYGFIIALLALTALQIRRNSNYGFLIYFTVFLLAFWTNTFDLEYHVSTLSPWITALAAGQWTIYWKPGRLSKQKKVTALRPVWLLTSLPSVLVVTVCALSITRVTDRGSFRASSKMFAASIMNKPALEESLQWIKNNTPAEPIGVDSIIKFKQRDYPYPPGAYGIVSAWDYGNSIIHLAERYAIWSRYPSKRIARWIFAADEAQALNILTEKCTPPEFFRYVLIDAPMVTTMTQALQEEAEVDIILETQKFSNNQGQIFEADVLGQTYQSSIGVRLYRHNGSGLQHHRLIYESAAWSLIFHQAVEGMINLRTIDAKTTRNPRRTELREIDGNAYYDYQAQPTVKIFEIVPGAQISGTASAGQNVRLSLKLVSTIAQREVVYEQYQRTDPQGNFTFTVPYATQHTGSSAVQATSPYELKIFQDSSRVTIKSVHITEEDIQLGHRITVQ